MTVAYLPLFVLQEWEKTFLAAALGYFAAIAAEPLKLRVLERYKMKRLRKLCYEGILRVRESAQLFDKLLENPGERLFSGVTHEEYVRIMIPILYTNPLRYAIDREAALFYHCDAALTVLRVVNTLDKIDVKGSAEEIKKDLHALVASIDRDVDDNRLSGKLLTKIFHGANWEELKLFNKVQFVPDELDQVRLGYRMDKHKAPNVFNPSITWLLVRYRYIREYLRVTSRPPR